MVHKRNSLVRVFFLFYIILCSVSCRPRVIRRMQRVKDPSLARVQVNGKLIVGIQQYYPPYTTQFHTQFVGFDIDVARAVAHELNIAVEFKALSWTEMETALANQKIDCIWTGTDPKDFANLGVISSEPYLTTTLVACIPKNSIYTSLPEMKNTDIGFISLADTLLSAGVMETLLRDYPNIIIYHDLAVALDALKRKKIDAMVGDIFTLMSLKERGEDFILIREPLKRRSCSVIFNKNDETLCNKINEALLKLEYEGTLEAISRKWFGSNVIILGK